MPAEFYLKTLGLPKLTTAVGHDIRIKVRKHLAVLVILAVEGGKIRRDRLVSMLWPSSRSDRARGSVATAISFLRGKLGGDSIEPGREFVELMPGLVGLDLDRLEKGEVVGDDFTPVLEVDGFLNGFELESLPEFESWRDRQHARLLPAIEKALVTLTDHSRRSGDLNALARHADRLLQLNDLSEWGIKARMEAYALSGDRITALRVYDDWLERLKTELKASPARMVEDLAHRLRRRSWDRPVSEPVVPPVRTEQWRDRVFVGRTREYRRLYDLWEEVKRGEARNILVTGDSGVGKTTLADRFATALALEGASVSRVRCFELERGIPFAMIGGALEMLLNQPGATAASPESLSELARILPEVRRLYPHLPLAKDLTGESARIRFADAAVDLLTAIMDEHPLVLVVDDFDQSDEASLSVLHFMMRHLRQFPLLAMLTSRTGARPGRGVFLAAKFGSEHIQMPSMDVEPLTSEESGVLFDALAAEAGVRPLPSEKHALLSAAAGFPLALELLVRDWQTNGARSTALAIRAMTSEVRADPEARYQQLTESLLADLYDTERVVVHTAAILDRRVSDLELYKVAAVPHAVLLGTLSRMAERRALQDTPHGLEWINPSVRAHAYLRIPQALRRVLHEAVADELKRREATGATVPGLEIAWHCFRAGRTEEGSEYLVRGAQDALLAGAPQEVVLAISTGLAEVSDAYRTRATVLLAEALQDQGSWEESLEHLARVSPLDEPLGKRARILTLNAHFQNGRLSLDERHAGTATLLSVAEDAIDAASRALALRTAAPMLGLLADLEGSQRLLRAAERIDLEDLDTTGKLRLALAKAMVLFYQRDLIAASEVINRALNLALEGGGRSQLYCSLLLGQAIIFASRAMYREAEQLGIQAVAYLESIGDEEGICRAACNLALSYGRLGNYEQQRLWVRRWGPPALSEMSRIQYFYYEGFSSGMLRQRDPAVAAAKALTKDLSPVPWLRQFAFLSAADVFLLAGERRKAFECGEEAVVRISPNPESVNIYGQFARWKSMTVREVTTREERKNVEHQLEGLLRKPIDLMDRVEILASLANLRQLRCDEGQEFQCLLSGLPPCTTTHLERLGLDSSQPAVIH